MTLIRRITIIQRVIMPCNEWSCFFIWIVCQVMSHHVISWHPVSNYVMSWKIVYSNEQSCNIVKNHITWCIITIFNEKSCYLMSCHVISRAIIFLQRKSCYQMQTRYLMRNYVVSLTVTYSIWHVIFLATIMLVI